MDFTVAHHFLTNEDAENKCAPSLSSPTSVPASGQPSEFESALRAALLSPGQHAPRSALSSTPLTSSGGGGGCEVSGIGLGSPARSGGSSGRVLAFSEPASPPRSLFGSDVPGLNQKVVGSSERALRWGVYLLRKRRGHQPSGLPLNFLHLGNLHQLTCQHCGGTDGPCLTIDEPLV